MTSPFQTELRARAAAHAREWQAAADPSVGLEEVEATVRRRRRGRGVLAGVGAVAAVTVVASVAYVGLGQAPDAGPGAIVDGQSAFDVLASVDADSVVLTMGEEYPNPSGFGRDYSVLVVDGTGQNTVVLSHAAVMEVLHSVADEWPIVTLAAVDSRLDRAIFVLDNPTAYVTPRVAIVGLTSGDVIVEDPCNSSLNFIDLSRWCTLEPLPESAVVIDPATGDAISLPGYGACLGAKARFGDNVVAICASGSDSAFLITVDPATGVMLEQTSLGLVPIQEPFVVGGSLYHNLFTTEGDAVLTNDDRISPDVAGGTVAGLGVVGDRLLVQTGSDGYGAPPSSYGRAIGLWSPSTGEFTEIFKLNGIEADSVTSVPVLP